MNIPLQIVERFDDWDLCGTEYKNPALCSSVGIIFGQGDAAQVLKAVNNHDALVGAVQAAIDALYEFKEDERDRELLGHLLAVMSEVEK